MRRVNGSWVGDGPVRALGAGSKSEAHECVCLYGVTECAACTVFVGLCCVYLVGDVRHFRGRRRQRHCRKIPVRSSPLAVAAEARAGFH